MEAARRAHLRLVAPADTAVVATVSDRDLVAAFRLRERGSAESLHDRARPVIEGTILRLLRARDADFDDLVQAALIELVGALRRWEGDALGGFITTVAARVVYKHLRRRKLERRVFERDFSLDLAHQACDPQTEASYRSALRRVRAHLAELDEKKAWAFLLHDVFGHDVREVAEIMDASVSAAQQRIARGRRELRERIARDPGLESVLLEFGGGR